jgi:hypothetical protein
MPISKSQLILILFLVSPSVYSLSCTISNAACTGTDVYHMSDATDAHAELYNESDYPYIICCQESTTTLTRTGSIILHISDNTDAHSELSNESEYANQISIGSTNGTLTCGYSNSVCPEACLGTISDNTDAHVGDCTTDPYNTYICCSFTPAVPTPPANTGSPSSPVILSNVTEIPPAIVPIIQIQPQDLNSLPTIIVVVCFFIAVLYTLESKNIKRWFAAGKDEDDEKEHKEDNFFTKLRRWFRHTKKSIAERYEYFWRGKINGNR